MSQLYFKAFFDLLETVEELSHEEVGRLFLACLEYGKTGIAPQLPGNERFVFPGIRAQIDRDRISYATRCEANRKNGEKGGRPAKAKATEKSQGNRKNPIGYFETEKSQDKEKDKDKEKEKEYIPPLPPTGESTKKPYRFVPPMLEEVQAYCEERKNSVDARRFVDHYTANGWMVGRTRMKDWRAAVRTWEKTEAGASHPAQPARASPPRPAVPEDDLPMELIAFYGGTQ